MPVAIAQAVVFAMICLLVFAVAKRVAGERAAIVAAFMTALFPPLPYFGALVLTELWTTFVIDRGGLGVPARAAARSRRRLHPGRRAVQRHHASSGRRSSCCRSAWRSRCRCWCRPNAATAAASASGRPWRSRPPSRWPRGSPTTTSTWAASRCRPPAGLAAACGKVRWQGRWSGRSHNELTQIAEVTPDRAALDARVRAIAAREGIVPDRRCCTYVHEWRDIRRIWETPTDPMERARARVVADQEYLRAAVAQHSRRPLGHVGAPR